MSISEVSNQVVATLIGAAILGLTAWLWGLQDISPWAISVLAAISAATITSVVISSVFSLVPARVSATSLRIGANGVEGLPLRYGTTFLPFPKKESHYFHSIGAEARSVPICTVSNVYVNSAPGSCELHSDGHDWQIQVRGGLECLCIS